MARHSAADEDVEIPNRADPSGVEKRLERLRHHRKDVRRETEAERKDLVLVEKAPPTEAQEAAEASIDGNVEVCIPQVYRRRR